MMGISRMSRPFRTYRHIILRRDLCPQSPSSCLAFRTMSERDIEAGGLAVGWEKGRIRKLPLSRIMYVKGGRKATYTISPRGRPQYRRQGPPSFQRDVSWGYSSRVDFAASSRMKTRTSSLKEIPRSWTTRAKGSPYESPGGSP